MMTAIFRFSPFSLALLGPPLAAAAAGAQDAAKTSFMPVVLVTLQIDSTSSAQFSAHGFELRIARADGALAPTSEIQLIKQAGAYTGSLVALGATGAHALTATIDVPDSLGKPAMSVRLTDVAIASDHVSLSTARANLEQQRIGLDEALSSLTVDYQEAQRELTAAEELNKAHGTTRMDLARARDHAADLQRRIDLLKRRQGLLASQISMQGALEETIVLHFSKLEIDGRDPGIKASIDLLGRPPGRDTLIRR